MEEKKKHSSSMKDANLVTASLSGEKEAFGELVLRHQRAVIGYLVSIVKDMELAEELTQETFFRAYKSLDDCRNPEKFRTWLVGIAHNCAREYFRKKQVALEVLPVLEDVAAPAEALEENEKRSALQAALRSISPELRRLIEMKYLQGMSCAEIARKLDRPLGTVTGQLSRVYDELWDKLARWWE